MVIIFFVVSFAIRFIIVLVETIGQSFQKVAGILIYFFRLQLDIKIVQQQILFTGVSANKRVLRGSDQGAAVFYPLVERVVTLRGEGFVAVDNNNRIPRAQFEIAPGMRVQQAQIFYGSSLHALFAQKNFSGEKIVLPRFL